ncbi:MAG: hypothetical protein NC115_07175 [Bacteroidales bacterium]|nr:hypothetical protein [Bacteroidales bacterium]
MEKILAIIATSFLLGWYGESYENGNDLRLYCKNLSDEDVILKWQTHYNQREKRVLLPSKDSVCVYSIFSPRSKAPDFEFIYEGAKKDEFTLHVHSVEDTLQKKTWNWESREDAGRQLFRESDCRRYEKTLETFDWVFDILPDELSWH